MRYEIERAVPGQGLFRKIAEVSAAGNNFSEQTYQYEDDLEDVPQGTVQYRIRQVIDTSAGGFMADYIDTASTGINSPCLSGSNAITLAPNPAKEALTLKINTAAAVPDLLIRIYNSLGQTVVELKRSKAGGMAFFDVPVYTLSRGKYYLSVYDGKKLIGTKELIKL